jgi:hypothetical protein
VVGNIETHPLMHQAVECSFEGGLDDGHDFLLIFVAVG